LKLNEIVPGKRLMVLSIGDNGSGKSGASASFGKLGKIHFYDFDGRMGGVAATIRECKFDPVISENLTYDTYGPKNFTKFMEEFERLQTNCPYKTIVVSSLTSLSLSAVNHVLGLKGSKIIADRFGLVNVPGWDEINAETAWIGTMLDICKLLPCHVILEAHPVKRIEVDGKNVKKSETLVCYGNKINGMVPGYFDEIWEFEKRPAIAGGGMERTVTFDSVTAKSSLSLDVRKLDISGKPLFDLLNAKVKIGG